MVISARAMPMLRTTVAINQKKYIVSLFFTYRAMMTAWRVNDVRRQKNSV